VGCVLLRAVSIAEATRMFSGVFVLLPTLLVSGMSVLWCQVPRMPEGLPEGDRWYCVVGLYERWM